MKLTNKEKIKLIDNITQNLTNNAKIKILMSCYYSYRCEYLKGLDEDELLEELEEIYELHDQYEKLLTNEKSVV